MSKVGQILLHYPLPSQVVFLLPDLYFTNYVATFEPDQRLAASKAGEFAVRLFAFGVDINVLMITFLTACPVAGGYEFLWKYKRISCRGAASARGWH